MNPSLDSAPARVIVIDALAARFGGTAYAAVQVAEALVRRSDVREVAVVARPDSIVERGVRRIPKIRRILVDATARPELAQRIAWEAFQLPRAVRRLGADGLLTLAGMLPRQPGCPFVALQANPLPYESPEGVGALVRRSAIFHTARSAAATYVPSEYVGRLVGELPRVRVVPLGVDRARFRAAEQPGDELLCVADFYPHKHHDLLLEMHRRLPEPRPLLRLIGNPAVDRACFERVRSMVANRRDVVLAGRVSFPDLLDAYSRARLFLIASDRESFCMPLAEALAAGVPAVARDYPTLRETAGPGAIYLSGYDPDSWVDAITDLLKDDRRLAELRGAGESHARRFSWDDFAEQLLLDLDPRSADP